MDDEKNWFQKFSSFMDQNIRGVQYGIYSIAGLGLLLALRSVRPVFQIPEAEIIGWERLKGDASQKNRFTTTVEKGVVIINFAKFSLPSDIPKHFIEKKIPFKAKVNLVEPGEAASNPLLLVDHHPLVTIAKKSKINDGLPLEISSVNVTNNGFIWLQNLLRGQEIKFVPLRVSSDRVYSIVYNEKQNVGEQLVKIGFAVVSPIDANLEKDEFYLKYYKNLISAERRAERKGAGLWADSKVPFSKVVISKIRSLFPFSLRVFAAK